MGDFARNRPHLLMRKITRYYLIRNKNLSASETQLESDRERARLLPNTVPTERQPQTHCPFRERHRVVPASGLRRSADKLRESNSVRSDAIEVAGLAAESSGQCFGFFGSGSLDRTSLLLRTTGCN